MIPRKPNVVSSPFSTGHVEVEALSSLRSHCSLDLLGSAIYSWRCAFVDTFTVSGNSPGGLAQCMKNSIPNRTATTTARDSDGAPPPPICTAQDAPHYDQSCAQAHGDGFCCDPKYIDWSGQCGGWLSNGDHLKTCYYKCPQKGWDPKTQSCKDTNL